MPSCLECRRTTARRLEASANLTFWNRAHASHPPTDGDAEQHNEPGGGRPCTVSLPHAIRWRHFPIPGPVASRAARPRKPRSLFCLHRYTSPTSSRVAFPTAECQQRNTPHGPGGIAKRWNHSTGTWENAAPAPEIPSAPPAHPAVARLIPRPRGAVCCENAANSLILPCAARARARAKTPRSRLRDIFPFIMRPLIPVQSHLFAPFLLLRSPLTMTLGGQCSGTLT